MSKKPSWFETNSPKLLKLCEEEGYEVAILDKYHYRVFAAAHVIDIWPSRMVYHRVQGEVILAHEEYHRELDRQFNEEQVKQLLATGEF